MISILSSLEVEPAISNPNLHSPTLGFESDPCYSGLELDHNLSDLKPVSVDYRLESAFVLNTKASSLFFYPIFAAMIDSKDAAANNTFN